LKIPYELIDPFMPDLSLSPLTPQLSRLAVLVKSCASRTA
jgi:hypothetical protein